MVSALYAVLSALLLMKFSFDVVRLRMQYRVAYGDGGFSELQSAIRIHGNAVEYIPIAIYGNEWRRNLDGAYLRHRFACWSSDALLRFSSPSVPLATFWHERHLVCAVADGAGESLVYALGGGFLPALAHNTPLSFSRIFTLCLTATRYFLPLSPDWATGPLMNG